MVNLWWKSLERGQSRKGVSPPAGLPPAAGGQAPQTPHLGTPPYRYPWRGPARRGASSRYPGQKLTIKLKRLLFVWVSDPCLGISFTAARGGQTMFYVGDSNTAHTTDMYAPKKNHSETATRMCDFLSWQAVTKARFASRLWRTSEVACASAPGRRPPPVQPEAASFRGSCRLLAAASKGQPPGWLQSHRRPRDR